MNLLHLPDTILIVQDTRTSALHGLPDGFILKKSSICDAGLGVFTAPGFTVRKDKVFGPYAGVIVLNQIEAHESGYCWQVACDTLHIFIVNWVCKTTINCVIDLALTAHTMASTILAGLGI